MPAYAPADEGGFYHFGLFHVTKDDDFQFSIEPVLESIDVTAPVTGHRHGTMTVSVTSGGTTGSVKLTVG
jgi:hypothetical protein